MADFPNVPFAPGVPALLRAPGDIGNIVELLTEDVVSLFLGGASPQWGLYLDGAPVVTADNVISFDYREQWKISNFPIEQGSFESYNKVQTPFDVKLRFSTGGSASNRQSMIASIAAAIASTDLYDAVTPEVTYQSVNVVHQDYDRAAAKGSGLLTIDVTCEQVRVATAAQFTDSSAASSVPTGGSSSAPAQIDQPQSPSAAPQVSGGTVQPVAVTSQQQSAVDGVVAQSMLPF